MMTIMMTKMTFMEFVLDIFLQNMFLNVNGFSASAVAYVCMKVVSSWPILHCATNCSRLLLLRRRLYPPVLCSLPSVSEKSTSSIFRVSEFG